MFCSLHLVDLTSCFDVGISNESIVVEIRLFDPGYTLIRSQLDSSSAHLTTSRSPSSIAKTATNDQNVDGVQRLCLVVVTFFGPEEVPVLRVIDLVPF